MSRRGPKPGYLTLVDAVEGVPDMEGTLCGGKTKRGKPCGRLAGWGTEHPGVGGCRNHPEVRTNTPDCPLPLNALEAELWGNVTEHMRGLGLLKAAFWPTMYGLVVALARLDECQKAIQEVVVKGDNSAVKKHPAATVANQMLSQIRAYSAELGITPSALAKTGAKEPDTPSDLDRLIKGN
jgi:P27 family predicted phage terminase small subunit